MIFSYGAGNEVTKQIGSNPGNLPPGTTLGRARDLLRATLGMSQNVEGLIGGVAQVVSAWLDGHLDVDRDVIVETLTAAFLALGPVVDPQH